MCSYCSFSKFVVGLKDIHSTGELWKKSVLLDLDHDVSVYNVNDVKVDSVFFGGGTPSLAGPTLINDIILAIQQKFGDSKMEISLEANPNVSSFSKNGKMNVKHNRNEILDTLYKYKDAGVNRLSLGIQSLNPNRLNDILNRNHNVDDALEIVELSKQVFGQDNINLDFIWGIPNQKWKDDWELELNQILNLNINHLSMYQLTFEKGTPLYNRVINNFNDNQKHSGMISQYPIRTSVNKFNNIDNIINKLSIPKEETIEDMYFKMINKLKDNGFIQYEVSAFAKKSNDITHNKKLNGLCIGQHNLGYWLGKEYIGIGPGSHGRIKINNNKWIKTMKHNVPSIYSFYNNKILDIQKQNNNKIIPYSQHCNNPLNNHKYTETWYGFEQPISKTERQQEIIATSLRTIFGTPSDSNNPITTQALFADYKEMNSAINTEALQLLVDQHLLDFDRPNMQLKPLGTAAMAVADGVVARLLAK